MNNNTSNYQEYTFPKLLEQYEIVQVPMIQRDYAQGRTEKKETDVRNNLLNDIFSDKDVHFDLVFGSQEKRIIDGKEMNCFIPVDGQQRLTTLFLLYLYGQKAGKTNIELDLSKFSYDTRRAASDFCKSITSEEWSVPNDKCVSDVIKDSSWFMYYWEKDPTVEGMLNMLDAIHEKSKKITDYPNLNKITFFFFDLESNGLNENLYLKMNSRGKPLTAFENLKAKIEKVLPEDADIEDKCFPKSDASPKDSFKSKWKYFMDRNWTETFWDSTNSDKYDVSIAKFIARFLAGYWAAFGQETAEKTTAEDLKKINRKEQNDKNYSDYIQFEPIKAVLELDDAFPSLAYALTTTSQIAPYWTNDTIKISDKSEYKFLAVIFTYVLFDGDRDAIRFAWNMAENYVTEYDTFVTFCKRAGEIYKFKCKNNVTFYQTLYSKEFVGNTSDQLKEEISKAEQILYGTPRSDGKSWKEIIIEAEKLYFFKGAIRFLFTKKIIGDDWNSFETKLGNARKFFDKDGVTQEFRTELTKKLVIQCDDWWIQLYDKQIYNPNSSTWKWILCSENWSEPIDRILTQKLEDIKQTTTNKDDNVAKYITPLLSELPYEWMIERIPEGRFRWLGPRLAFYKPYGREYILFDWSDFKRRKILNAIKDKIKTEHRINNGNFFWGWNIQFTYKDEFFFQWQGDDYVLMIKDLSNCEPFVKDISKEKPEEKWLCFRPTLEMEANIEKFTESLDRLIGQLPKS